MNKCKTCGTELQEMQKTIVVDNVEYETETHDKGKKLSDITVPKGWRLWRYDECIKLFNSHKKELNKTGEQEMTKYRLIEEANADSCDYCPYGHLYRMIDDVFQCNVCHRKFKQLSEGEGK